STAPSSAAKTLPRNICIPLSLHDALPICSTGWTSGFRWTRCSSGCGCSTGSSAIADHRRHLVSSEPELIFAEVPCRGRCAGHRRSEEHTSELQSRANLVCRLLLERKTTAT